MHKTLLLSTLFLLLLVACQQRPCPQATSHNGLYNALTCDYKSKNFNLQENLSNHKSKTVELQKERNTLKHEIYKQEDEVNYQKEQIENQELLLSEIEKDVDNIKAEIKTKKILENLNAKIKNMHKELKEANP